MGLVIDNIEALTEVESICELGAIDTDCPWKKYEGLTNKEFITKNFSSLQKHLGAEGLFFEEKMADSCKEVVFIKTYIKALNKSYWLTIYLCNHRSLKNYYIVAGEPLVNSIELKQSPNRNLWKGFPRYLQDFWRVHSFWFDGSDDNSFDLKSIIKTGFPTYTEDGHIIHPQFLCASEYNSFVEQDYISLCIQDESNIYDEEDKQRIFIPKEYTEIGLDKYVEKYLKQAIYSHDTNGDGIYYVPSSTEQVDIFWHGYNDVSYFYRSFAHYLLESSSLGDINKK